MLPNEMSSDTSNALRVQSTRSSTGCQTCKNRRIKCDEGRPRCQKCLKSNRLCSYSAHQSDSWKKFVVYPTPGASRPSPTPPDLVPSEQRALYYFRCHAAKRITAPFRSELWVDCIFQLTESYDFVQSALVAFSTMHESFTQSPEARTRLQHVAERHYNKALSHISNAKQSDLSVDAVLVACIIFYSLESLRGAIYRALQHAHSGIKIMRDNQHRPSPPFPGETALTGALFRDFLALQNQVDELSDSTTCRAYDSVEGFAPRICDQFVSIEDALHHVEILHNEVYCLGDYCARLQQNNNNLDELFPTEIAPRYEKIVRRFDHWSHGIAKLEATTQNNPADPTFSGHLILKIYESIGRCMLSMFSSSDCFNTYDPGLAHGIDQIERFLDHQSTEANDEHQTFSVSIGVIPLLFTLCYRCNNLALRDRSMQLLRRSKRREGLWDSEMAVAMAARVISLKDDLAASGRPETSATVQVSEISFVSEDVVQMTLIYSDPDNAVTADKSFVSFDGPELTRRVEVMKLSTVLVQPS